MMSEEEAKTRWCPFVRHSAVTTYPAANRGNNATNNRCMGSGCAVWTWTNAPAKQDLLVYKDKREEALETWPKYGWTLVGESERNIPGASSPASVLHFTRPELGRCGLTHPNPED